MSFLSNNRIDESQSDGEKQGCLVDKLSWRRVTRADWQGVSKFLGIAALFTAMSVTPSLASAAVDRVHDFESGDLGLGCHGNCPIITDEIPARSGKYSMRSFLSESSQNLKRTEGIFKTSTNRWMEWNRDYWIGFSVYIPEGWKHYDKFEILAQIHATVDPGEPQQQPPFAIYTGSGEWKITSRWNTGQQQVNWPLNSVYEDTGKWTDFVIHYKPSYTDSGVLRVWKNGDLVARRYGPNAYDDQRGPYFTMGLYTSLYTQTDGKPRKFVYHDALRVASGPTARYSDVAPSGSASSASDEPAASVEEPKETVVSNTGGSTGSQTASPEESSATDEEPAGGEEYPTCDSTASGDAFTWEVSPEIDQEHNFDSGNFTLQGHGNSPTVTSHFSHSGGYSMKSTVSNTSKNRKRTQGIIKSKDGRVMQFDRDYWIGFSVYLPEDWQVPGKREILAELRRTPDAGESHSAAFEIHTGTGEWRIRNLWEGGRKDWVLGSVFEDVGRWTDFVIHYKPSFTSSGVLEVWKDGVLVARRNGPNTQKDANGPFLALGLLKDAYKAPVKSVYHDSLRIASGPGATLEDVMMQGQATQRVASCADTGTGDQVTEEVDSIGLDHNVGFETGELLLNCHGNCPTVTTQLSRDGDFAMKSTVSKSSNNKKRTQAKIVGKQNRQMVFDRDYWIGFSVYLPNDWDVPGKREILAEILRTPDPGERSSAAFEIRSGSGDWEIRSRWGSDEKSWVLSSVYESVGRWTDFVIHYRPSSTPSGILEVWKDGTLVARRVGRNIEKDAEGPYLLLGLLKDYPSDSAKTVYHDALRIASGPDARYEDVAL